MELLKAATPSVAQLAVAMAPAERAPAAQQEMPETVTAETDVAAQRLAILSDPTREVERRPASMVRAAMRPARRLAEEMKAATVPEVSELAVIRWAELVRVVSVRVVQPLAVRQLAARQLVETEAPAAPATVATVATAGLQSTQV